MKDIDKLLKEAEFGLKGNLVESRITDEAKPFWDAVKDRILKDGVSLKPYTLTRILDDNFNIKISETAMRNYLKDINNE